MGGRGRLGEFELLVLLAVMRRRGAAYGLTIAAELEERTGDRPSRGALYITLKRLEEKGYLESELGVGASERGNHRRRFYGVTTAGVAAVSDSRRAMRLMWAGLEGELEST